MDTKDVRDTKHIMDVVHAKDDRAGHRDFGMGNGHGGDLMGVQRSDGGY